MQQQMIETGSPNSGMNEAELCNSTPNETVDQTGAANSCTSMADFSYLSIQNE